MQHLEFWPKLCEQRYTQNKNCLPPFFQILYRERGECNIALRGVVSGAVRPVVLPSPHSPSLALEQSMYGHWLKIALLFRWICCFKVQTSDRNIAHITSKNYIFRYFLYPKIFVHSAQVTPGDTIQCWSLLSNKLCYDLWYTLYCRSSTLVSAAWRSNNWFKALVLFQSLRHKRHKILIWKFWKHIVIVTHHSFLTHRRHSCAITNVSEEVWESLKHLCV